MSDESGKEVASGTRGGELVSSGRRASVVLAWIWTGLIVVGGIAVVLTIDRALLGSEGYVILGATALYAVLGLLIAIRQTDNRIGWLLLLIATGLVISGATESRVADTPPDPVTLWDVLAIIWSNTGYFVALLIPLLLLAYIFPTGRFLSRRWSSAGWAAGVAVAALLYTEVFTNEVGPSDADWTVQNPLGFHDLAGISEGILGAAFGIILLGLILGVPVAIVFRYRRSALTVRTQIKLVLLAMSLVPLIFIVGTAFPDSWMSTVAYLLAISALPLAIAVAILRHNLFDIDLVISRSLTFGLLVVFIGGVYVGIVVGVGAMLGQAGGSSFGLSVVATAVVALGFQPVRVRVERWANRLVYGKRATPYEVLARFSHRVAEEPDGEVLERIPRLIVDGTGASGAAVWVRDHDERYEAVAVWPEDVSSRSIEGVDVFVDPDADVSLPVVHDGEVLGGLSLSVPRGGSITPPERELVTRLADGLGLTLRNSQLTAALRRQVVELERSRDRVVSAADRARRSLEHDLDSGPQQQLVAVKVQLGPVRRLAEQAGAERTADVLADIESQASDAIQAVRDFAAGIYPPLLGAEGLAVALGQEARKAAMPVELVADGIGRYPREVESAVYFSVLEALQNTAKYAHASRAVVRLDQREGELWFEVSDDGRGFDVATVTRGAGLNGIGDRLDTVGATWTLTSSPGHGTTITASVPLTANTQTVPIGTGAT